MRPEDELRPTDEGGLAAAPARPSAADARAAVTGGFDVGAAAAAVAAAAAQPLAAPLLQDVAPLEPAWRAAAAVLAPTAIAPAGEAAPDLRAEVPPDAPYAFDGAGEDLADPAAGAVATADAAAAPAAGDAADGASDHALDPASARAVDPASGWVIEPNSGWLVEPTTGYLLDPGTGYYVEPTTGYYVDPSTGYLLDPATGYPLDPATGYPFDPATGLPIDVSAYQDAAAATAPVEAGSGDVAVEAPPDLGIAHAELVAGEAETQPALDVAAAEVEVAVAVADSLPTDRLPTESPPAAELPSVAEPEVEIDQVAIEQVAIEHGADADDEATLLPSAGFAPTADLSGDVEERSSEEVPAAAAEPPSAVEVASPSGSAEPTPARDLFTDLPAGDALSFSAEPIDAFAAPGEAPFDDVAAIGFTDVESERDAAGAAEEPLVGPPLDLWEAFGPAPDATGDAGTSPAEPVSHAAAPADDGGKTTMWDLGAAAAGG
ncbi:MAG: OCRE domain-containing protein, partial [Anaeromyxobacteraceae bacterium]